MKLKLAECCYKLSQIQEALNLLEQAQSSFTSDQDVCHLETLRGKCLDRQKLYSQAIAAYQSALVLAVGEESAHMQAQLHLRLGWVYVRSRGGIDTGIEHLRKAHRIHEASHLDQDQHCEVMSKLASVLFREHKLAESLKEAKELCAKVLVVQPKNLESQLLLAKILDRECSNEEAIEAYNKALKMQTEAKQPPKANIFFHIGAIHERMKDFKKAVLNYKKCLTLDAKHFGACIHLANLLANVGEG